MDKFKYYLEIVRDVGVVLSVPIIITVGVSLQNKQIEVMESQLRLAESLTYDKALQVIQSQEELFNKEIATQKEQLKACVFMPFLSGEQKDFFRKKIKKNLMCEP